MKIKDLIRIGSERLKEAGIKTPVTDTQILLSYVLKLPRWKLITEREEEIPKEKVMEFFSLIERRAQREPLAYITGEKAFYGLDFKIKKGVLIPRPETEILVDEVLKRIPEDKRVLGLEIGVGSGVISISLLKYRHNLFMYGVDISEKALELTRENAKIHRVSSRLKLLKSDLFKDVPHIKFDFIVSNPPYVSAEEYAGLEEEVKKEPVEALIGGKGGIEFYERIVKEGKIYLKEKGFFGFEIGYTQSDRVKKILQDEGFNVKVYKDLQDYDRVVIGERNG
ncbi:MAG TPA: peptide chain release factor N(5)-glutamine methyltransferase [Persephonella sp.]|uniref:Release factor glutamine methyltransferase n=1 Tax=Persephonella marina (strain DSM 14350 / EX-H1) TaxID=123214 RepID=C0QT71_PERMH|nr:MULTISPECIES: peptide chain release factor N(5)-glutamine methyltransferase [Persephonella]ACO04339.1 protein-(glutamine-N5) methyltransferase, release factor-specific [Persephonella marina EX-H1]HCB70495.1 peptide chain release factor N(5)-glutamine methyltransferase [Persephonella sp.]